MKDLHIAEMERDDQRLLILFALLPNSVSLDVLLGVLGGSPVMLLRKLAQFGEREIVLDDAVQGDGFYKLANPAMRTAIFAACPFELVQSIASELLAYFEEHESGDETLLTIANIYHAANLVPQNPAIMFLAAKMYFQKHNVEEACKFLIFILDQPESNFDTDEKREIYVKAALRLTSTRIQFLHMKEQITYLRKALEYARELDDKELEARTYTSYGWLVARYEGNSEYARELFEHGWELAQEIKRPALMLETALFSVDFLLWQGRIVEAVKRYEDVIGNVEILPDNRIGLQSYALLAWSYGLNGQVSRGLGLVDSVRKKAIELDLKDIEDHAFIIALVIMFEYRVVSEPVQVLEELKRIVKANLDFFTVWIANRALAYIYFLQEDYDNCLKHMRESLQLSRKFGWHQFRGAWNLEMMYGMEQAGYKLPGDTFTDELDYLLQGPNIYIKGVAHRYRALARFNEGETEMAALLPDIHASIELLTEAAEGGPELVKVRVLQARALIVEGNLDAAMPILQNAWSMFAPTNPELFPDDLKSYLAGEEPMVLLLQAIVEMGETIGTIRDRNRLFEQIITLIMRFTMARRGALFLVDDDGKLNIAASRNFGIRGNHQKEITVKVAMSEAVFASGEGVIHKEVLVTDAGTGEIGSEEGWAIVSPIRFKAQVFGVVYLDGKSKPVNAQAHSLRFLALIGSQVGLALDNLRAYEEISSLKDRLSEETFFIREQQYGHAVKPGAEQIKGESEALRKTLDQLAKVAPTDSVVLITGETGSGKELIASALHRMSLRAQGPFIPVNVSAMPDTLVMTELFGHEKGAFTGADKRRLGRFELARGGTLFLDEVQSLSLDAQVKLLRVIETGKFERVGGAETIESDFRLVAACNQDLEKLVDEGKFRADLYFRLNVFPIHVSPLRERESDIPILAMYFLEMFKQKFHKEQIQGISKQSMQKLKEYYWPGNVRELQHVIERAVILTDGGLLVIPDLETGENAKPKRENFVTLEEMERNYIVEVLRQCNWRVSGPHGAAVVLDINPQTLYARLRKLGIKRNVVYED